MALTFIQGLPGSGKTEYCLREIVAKSAEPAQHSLIYLVPEQFSLQSEKHLIACLPHRAMTRVQVLSFQRLAYHVFAEQGRSPGKFIDDTGKAMLLRKIVANLHNELVFFGKAADRQGFMDQLCGTITEFFQYGVTPDALNGKLNALSETDSIRLKMADLYLIYKNYMEYLASRFISTDAILDILTGRIPGAGYLAASEIWIDGFTSFTPQELKVIACLMQKAAHIKVTVTVNEKGNRYAKLAMPDFFYETKNTVNKVSKQAEDKGVAMEPPVFLPELKRYASFPALRFFMEAYYCRGRGYSGPVDNIYIIPASDKYAEIAEAAHNILELVREKGYRYRDIALVAGDLPGYEKGIAAICGQYGIPVFIDNKADILAHPLAEAIRAAVDVVVYNFSYESVFRFLKTNLISMDRGDVDILENYVLAYGIKGYKWKLADWHFGFGGEDGLFDKEGVNRSRERVMACLGPFMEGLSAEKKYAVKELASRVYAMLYRIEAPGKINRWVTEATARGENQLARQHSQIWGKVCDIFDKMVEILGNEKVSAKEFGKILDAGFAGTSMGIIPPSADQLLVGDLTRTKLPEIKALFVLGTNDGLIPAPVQESGLVTDDERALLHAVGIELALDSKRRAKEDQFLIYTAFGKPKEHLFISYSIGDLAGKSLRPSAMLRRLGKIFPRLAESEPPQKNVSLPVPMLKQMGGLLRHYVRTGEMDPVGKEVYAWLMHHHPYSEKLRRVQSYLAHTHQEESISTQAAGRLYGREIITAASRIEKYMECPFAYFMQYNLGANERKMYRVGAMDMGSLFHSVLERFAVLLTEQGLTWRSVPRERLDELVNHCVDEIAPQMGDNILLSTARHQYIIERVRRVCKRSVWALWEHVQKGMFEPCAAELAFKSGSPLTGISVNLNDRQRLVLTGRIDRVDVMDAGGNRYIKVIDYKTGNVKFDLGDVYFGMQMQLMLYLDAVIKNSDVFFAEGEKTWDISPGGVFYFNINDPIVDYDGADERLEDMLLKTFKMSGLVLAEDEVVRGMDRDIAGDSDIIPVSVKKSGEFGARSSIMDQSGFTRLREHVIQKMKEAGNEMASGRIAAFPFKKGSRTGCDYCRYGAVCGIEVLEKKVKYNVMKN